MKVLMIGLSDGILQNQLGDVRERHIEYARRIGNLKIIVYSAHRRGLEESKLSPQLTVYPSNSLSCWHFIRDAFRLGCRIIDQSGADLITTQDPFSTGLIGYLLKRRYRIPLQVQNHSDFFDNRRWISERFWRNSLFNWLGKFVVRRADVLRVVNQNEADKYLALGIPKERIIVQAVPVDIDRFGTRPANGELLELRQRLGLTPSERVVLWVGRPVALKRLDLWCEVLKLVRDVRPDVKGVVVGDLNFSPELPKLALRLGLGDGIVFTGRVEHEDLPLYFALADVYLHTSIYEGLPRVLLEAGAAGRPVVTTATSGGAEVVIAEKTGIVSQAKADALAAEVLRLLDDQGFCRKTGDAAREWVSQNYTWEKSMANIVSAWQLAAGLGKSR